MVYALSVAFPVLGFTNVEVASLIFQCLETVGRLLSLFGADGELLLILYVAGDDALLEAVVDVVRFGAHAAHVAFDEYAEDAYSVAPLANPSVAVLYLIVSPSEELAASCVPVVASTATVVVHHCASSADDVGKHLLHVVGSQCVAVGVGLCMCGGYRGHNAEYEEYGFMFHRVVWYTGCSF